MSLKKWLLTPSGKTIFLAKFCGPAIKYLSQSIHNLVMSYECYVYNILKVLPISIPSS
jgi:hypothetical protein